MNASVRASFAWLIALVATLGSVRDSLAEGTEYVAISLRELRSHLEKPQAATLCGATRLRGFVLSDKEGDADCILLGEVERGRPVLRLEDFAVAYDNVVQQRPRPECFISPRPDVVQRVDELSQQIMAAGSPAMAEDVIQEWRKAASELQDVRVRGVGSDTHFAKVMVDADYLLKGLCYGAEKIAGVSSPTGLRGRYGRGPEGFGLLKSEWALASPQAQMALYMPPEMPRPNDSSATDPVPQYDRRHHYIWMLEYRGVNVSQEQRTTSTGETRKTTSTWRPTVPVYTHQLWTSWTITKASVTPSDSRQAMRLVGFLEYGNAITKLQPLVTSSPQAELAVYDELVKDRLEFTVFGDRSRRLERAPSTLRGPGPGAQGSERRGLCWATALARLEFAAMLATFSEVPSPFENVGVTAFDVEAYRELLLDGARTHYWALRNDPALPTTLRGSSLNQQTLSYSRRVKLARAMLSAAARLGEYSPEQYQELSVWQDSLKTLDARLDASIGSALATTQVSKGREWVTDGAAGYASSRVGPWVAPGIQFVNWPIDQGYPGLWRDLVQMTRQMK